MILEVLELITKILNPTRSHVKWRNEPCFASILTDYAQKGDRSSQF